MMPHRTSNDIRTQFLEYFRSKQHDIVPSSLVVPHDDPTLLFTNAGMNQFKPIFLGTISPNDPHSRMKRAADTQKCIRAGGKHNDLDDVGKDTYHHTFFEMLGNWSFGDYFKQEAIEWAWELLTKVWGVDKKRLHATYFQGDPAEGLEPDGEAAALWRTVTDIDPTHIHPGNKKDNFWEMGDTGPCGPCSEIHVDLTPDMSGGHLVNAGDARVMEIWNLVFIQFNRGTDGKLTPLPAKHVDTGMGFERICSVLQAMEADRLGSFSNYDTDVFSPIFLAIQKRTGAPKYQGTLPGSEKTNARSDNGGNQSRERERPVAIDQIMIDVSYRVIADHLRCLTFALTDGAVPSNEGRGYVLRRILRRAVRYGRQYLNMHEPFLCDLVPSLVEHMGDVFSELRTGPDPKRPRDNVKHVAESLREEEASFIKTLDRGIRLFNEAAEYAVEHHHGRIGGEAAFKLHDTYGFPIDLTELMAEERGLNIDIGEYERLMEEARAKARVRSGSLDPILDGANFEGHVSAVVCDDSLKYAMPPKCNAKIISFARNMKANDTDSAKLGDDLVFQTNKTCFYAEQGGQASDVGEVTTSTGAIEVLSVARRGEYFLHRGVVIRGEIWPGQDCELEVSLINRIPTMQNHSATHIMNWALREVLGDHVQQKGSLVDPEKTRFDLSHPHPISNDELARIEKLTNEQIAAKLSVYTQEVDQAAARKINTLRAVFGEKYPERVRVVSIGAPIGTEDSNDKTTLLGNPEDPKWMKYSVEFCGGTHVKNSGEIEQFVLVAEEGVAKGVRRVVGVSGEVAKKAIDEGQRLQREAAVLVTSTVPTPDLASRIASVSLQINDAVIPILVRHELREKIAELQKVAKQQEKQSAAASGDAVMEKVAQLLTSAKTVGGVTVVVGEVPAAPVDSLRGAIDWVRNKTSASAVLLAMVDEGRVTLMAGMSKAVVDRGVKAGDLIKDLAPLVGGKGGGRPDMAQGGGTDVSGLPQAMAKADEWIGAKLG